MQFDILYADCPWHWKTWSDKGKDRSAEMHYSVLGYDRLMALKDKVIKVSKPDSVLFMWAIGSMLPTALQVMQEWGFQFKTVAFTWIKLNKVSPGLFTGLGYYTRQNAEYVLLGTRGKPLERESRGVHSVVVEDTSEQIVIPRCCEETVVSVIGAHSVKPQIVRDRIVELYGYDRSRLEMFARSTDPNYVCVGNEITGRDIVEDLERLAKQ